MYAVHKCHFTFFSFHIKEHDNPNHNELYPYGESFLLRASSVRLTGKELL